GRIEAIGVDEDITLVDDQDNADRDMFDVIVLGGGGPKCQETIGDTITQTTFESVSKHSNDSLLARGGEEVFAATGQNENVVNITTKELTLAQALEALKTSKPKVKGLVIQESGRFTTTTISSQQSQDKGKGIMIEEPVKPKKKNQIRLDEEAAKRAFRRVNTFVDYRTKLVKGKEKRAGEELIQKSTKKQKVEDDNEKDELKQLMKTIPDEEEVAIDAIPLANKSPRIVD
nr:hypothetical protein [Tanacetum cinerariifolium]